MRWCCALLVLLSLFGSLYGGRPRGLRICSYNVDALDQTKASNQQALHVLVRILSRCHISLLQNVVDPSGEVMDSLVSALNRLDSERYDEHNYTKVSSALLGKSSDDMQQYVFIYRQESVNVTGQHQIEDRAFARPPFAVHFQSNRTLIGEFILVPLHSHPDQVVQELDRLYDVFEEVSTKWNNTNVMFLGDFHAGCAYVTRTDRKSIRLFTNSSFSWLIGDREDTTVTDETHCPYDRVVVHGADFLQAVVPYSAEVFNFGRSFKISKTKVLEVSDHFPVEVRLKGSALPLQASPLTPVLLLGASLLLSLSC